MKILIMMLAVAGWLSMTLVAPAQVAEKTTIKLVGGEIMTGTAGEVKDGALSLITEYGPVRIPVEKISPESRVKLGISGDAANSAALAARVRELEVLVAKLREENATLRRTAASAQAVPPAVDRVVPAPAPAVASGEAYRMSSTGKRHNSRCRYYNSSGRACKAGEGVACKICGG
jgi:hypothetical protein